MTWALQAFLLICIAATAATQRIHSFKSTLWAHGAVVVALGMVECSTAYFLLGLAAPMSKLLVRPVHVPLGRGLGVAAPASLPPEVVCVRQAIQA